MTAAAKRKERRRIVRSVPNCGRCGKPLTAWWFERGRGRRHVSPGYAFACKLCEEDYLNFEVESDGRAILLPRRPEHLCGAR